jgi:hypothetical protein
VFRLRLLLAAASIGPVVGASCGPPKQARDPHEILREEEGGDEAWGEQGGDEAWGEQGGVIAPDAVSEPTVAQPAADPPATRAQCEAAARRTVELGLQAVGAEQQPTADAPLSPEQTEVIVARAVEDCLKWSVPRSEAECVARARRAADIEDCVR